MYAPAVEAARGVRDADPQVAGPAHGDRAAGVVNEEETLRAGAYGLLAALLRAAPDQTTLERLRGLDVAERPGEDPVATSLRMLGLAARDSRPGGLADEFQALFVGIGRGELVPFGSWYLTGFLMERPLSQLRDDLARLGFERQPDVREPEDHVAALCEVMALLIQDGVAHETQREFFERHLGPWLGRFCGDLETARTAVFYRAVGAFGGAFNELEQRYFSMRV
ncbi:MAG: molecular chaperone TorD family protein [Burkholderiales bacterium]|nr:MAG: molecular chaperone TorD family protein [Burkholderiales bacterium]